MCVCVFFLPRRVCCFFLGFSDVYTRPCLIFSFFFVYACFVFFVGSFVRSPDGSVAEAVAQAEDAGEQGASLLPDDETARHLGGEYSSKWLI